MILERIRDGEVLVVGLARSGISTVRFLLSMGAKKIIINDRRQLVNLTDEEAFLENNPQITMISGGHPSSLVNSSIALLVKSPGVPPHLEIIANARKNKIPVVSEIELAYHFIKSTIIGITGTNGKTTTTTLISEIFKRDGGSKIFTVGNIGIPLTDIAKEANAGDIIIAELSSFQLDDIIDFRPAISVILNIGEDHLDYHQSRENYFEAKEKIIKNQLSSDITVLNADDPEIFNLHKKTAARPVFFSNKKIVEGFCLKEGILGLNFNGSFSEVCPVNELSLPGEHNLQNALAAAAASWSGGVRLSVIGEVLRDFKGVEHRLEYVTTINGVTFVNDSKGTNPEAAIMALQSYPGKNIILIAGGKDKESDFKQLIGSLKENNVKLLILLGETAAKIKNSAIGEDYHNYRMVKSLEEAVEIAWESALEGDVILLSPACASWDMFNNFEERGNLFKDRVKMLDSNI